MSPLRIEAENYTSFEDKTANNKGGAYRNDSVDIGISKADPNDIYVGWIEEGESLGFEVDVEKTGTYRLEARIASKRSSSQFNVIADGQQTIEFKPSSTGNWYSFQTFSANQTFSLTKGRHNLKVEMVTDGYNLDYFDLVFVEGSSNTDSSNDTGSSTGGGESTSNTGNNVNNSQLIRIQAENYTSFEDKTANNKGGAYRNDSVDIGISKADPNDIYVGWIQQGESLGFEINVEKAGTYRLEARVASKGGNGQFNVIADGQQTVEVMTRSTGNWYSFQNFPAVQTFSLTKGRHDLKVDMITDGYNLDYFDLVYVSGDVAPHTSPAKIQLNLGNIVQAKAGKQSISGNSTAQSVDYAQVAAGITADLKKGTVTYDIKSFNGGPLRIMPLGDSLTQGAQPFDLGGYRDDLWNSLKDRGYNADFVGDRSTGSGFDADHAGVPKSTISDITARIKGGLLGNYPADGILLMAGTNDNLQTNRFKTLDEAVVNLDSLVGEITSRSPNTHIFLASIPPLDTAGPQKRDRIADYNLKLSTNIANKYSNVTFVDAGGQLNKSHLIEDGIHLTTEGNRIVAKAYEQAIASVFNVGSDSTTSAYTDNLNGINNLIGTRYNDRLIGNAADNILIGDKGDDILTGGEGADKFVLSASSGFDTITDFQLGKDTIVLADGLKYESISIVSGANFNYSKNDSLLMRDNSEQLALLLGIRSDQLDASSFAVA